MRSKSIAVVVAWVAVLALLMAAGLACAAPAPGYDELLAQAKSDNAAVNFRALRYAYAESGYYDPYDANVAELRASMVKAFAGEDCANAIKSAQAIVEKNYVYIDAHMVLDLCYRRFDQPQQAKHHGLMAHGLINSIVASGDGKSPKTAFVVISVAEEYTIMNVLGLRKVRQAPIKVEGHRYDQISVEKKSGGSDSIFFNIDLLYAGWLRNNKNH